MKTVVVNTYLNNIATYDVVNSNAIYLRVTNKSTHIIYIYPSLYGSKETGYTVQSGQTIYVENIADKWYVEVTANYNYSADCTVTIEETNYITAQDIQELQLYQGVASKFPSELFIGAGWYYIKAFENSFSTFSQNSYINIDVYQGINDNEYHDIAIFNKTIRLYPLTSDDNRGTYHFRYFYIDKPSYLYFSMNNISSDCQIELYKITTKPTWFTQSANMGNYFTQTPTFQGDFLKNLSIIYHTSGASYSADFIISDISYNNRLIYSVSGASGDTKKLDVFFAQTGYNSDIFLSAESVTGIQWYRIVCYYEV